MQPSTRPFCLGTSRFHNPTTKFKPCTYGLMEVENTFVPKPGLWTSFRNPHLVCIRVLCSTFLGSFGFMWNERNESSLKWQINSFIFGMSFIAQSKIKMRDTFGKIVCTSKSVYFSLLKFHKIVKQKWK